MEHIEKVQEECKMAWNNEQYDVSRALLTFCSERKIPHSEISVIRPIRARTVENWLYSRVDGDKKGRKDGGDAKPLVSLPTVG